MNLRITWNTVANCIRLHEYKSKWTTTIPWSAQINYCTLMESHNISLQKRARRSDKHRKKRERKKGARNSGRAWTDSHTPRSFRHSYRNRQIQIDSEGIDRPRTTNAKPGIKGQSKSKMTLNNRTVRQALTAAQRNSSDIEHNWPDYALQFAGPAA